MQAYSRRPRPPRPALQLPSGRLVRITANDFIIGSGEGCDLRLKDSHVAARHVIVQRGEGYWQAALLNLDAGATVNKVPIQGIVRLQHGDTLQVGRTRLRYVEDDAAVGMTGLLWSRMWLAALILVAVLVAVALALAARDRGQTPAVSPPAVATAAPVVPTNTPSPTAAPPEAEATAPIVLPTAEATSMTSPTASPTAVSPSPTVVAPAPDSGSVPGCPQPEGWQTVIVAEGERLADFAERYNISRARLQRANCLDSFSVQPGQMLYVPQ